jgi:hypothetical protein
VAVAINYAFLGGTDKLSTSRVWTTLMTSRFPPLWSVAVHESADGQNESCASSESGLKCRRGEAATTATMSLNDLLKGEKPAGLLVQA